MTVVSPPSHEAITTAIAACVANGEKLEAESYDLEFREPPSLQLYVLLIAQEEFAKAFLLLLVRDGIIPFTRPLLRAMNDHTCKQLAGVVMDYIATQWKDWASAQQMVEADLDLGDRLPPPVESAVLLLRFEKIGRWQSKDWEWESPPDYAPEMVKVAEGSADRRKQDALYVRIGGDGRAIPPPTIGIEDIDHERERLGDFKYLVKGFTDGPDTSYRQQKAVRFIREVFAEAVG